MNQNKPILTLNMDEKIYLAVAKNTDAKKAFVFTLACLKNGKGGNNYNLIPTREIHSFKTRESADLYYDAIDKIVEINSGDEAKQPLFSANEKLIERFMENVR